MMKTKLHLFLVYTVFISVLHSFSQTKNHTNLEASIDSLIPTAVNDTTPGLVVGIVQKGQVVFSKGYGMANLSYSIPNTPEMVYNIGSVSKQFLGYAFAMLHEQGVVNIDDPVSNFLEDWPTFKHTVTLRHLLTHSSGYREAYTMSNLAGRIIGEDRLSRAECLDVIRKQPALEFTPGSRYTYNSTAWVILAEVLETITKQPADKWVQNNILTPLNMSHTQIESSVGDVINNAAESYTFNQEHGYLNQTSNRAIFGAAEIYTSIPDLAKWITNYRTAEIGGKDVNKIFLEPYILSNNTNSQYALGIGISTYRGLKRYRHTGGHEAFLTQLSYFPEHDLGIIVISNYGRKAQVSSEKIADLLLGEYMTVSKNGTAKEVSINNETLEQFSGLYMASTLNNVLQLSFSNNSLSISGRAKLLPISQNTFQIEGQSQQLKIEKTSEETNQLTLLNGRNETYTKVKKWVATEQELKEFEGDYWSEELETVYHIKIKEHKLFIEHRWLGSIPLTEVTEDMFNSGYGFFLKFNRNSKGDISNLSINSSRTLNVIFQRQN